MDDLTTERNFDSQAKNAIDVLGSLFWHVIYATRHWRKSEQLVQELNVCSVEDCCYSSPRASKFSTQIE